MSSATRLILFTESLGLSGPVKVADVFALVAVAGGDTVRIDGLLRELYSWHHARGVTGLQIAFAPAVVAGLALASHGASSALLLVAAAFLIAALAAGIWRLRELHRFDREFLFALGLAKTVADLQSELWARQRALMIGDADTSHSGRGFQLYNSIGHLTLAECMSDERAKASFAHALANAGVA